MTEKEFYSDGRFVYKKPDPFGSPQASAQKVCYADPDVPGAAEEIADALNFKPKALELLVQAVAVMRGKKISAYDRLALAAEIEEFIVNG